MRGIWNQKKSRKRRGEKETRGAEERMQAGEGRESESDRKLAGGGHCSPSPTRQPLTPMRRGSSVPNDHMAEGRGEGGCLMGRRGRISETERKRMRRGSLCVKLEKFIIYHYTQPEMPPN